MPGFRKSPLPELKSEKRKIPVIKASEIGFSMRNQTVEPEPEKAPTTPASAPAVNETYEDFVVYEKDLHYYWRDFAHKLPNEEKAN